MVKHNFWTKEQTIIALYLYCKIPFNKVSSSHPEIIRIAKLIGRTPNSVKMKIGNFGSFDPELRKRGIVGLGNTSKMDEIIWNEFNLDWGSLAYESELIISKFTNEPIEKKFELNIDDIPIGRDREAVIKQRVNQSFFRSMVLSSYNFRCCITGLSISDFLVASHIVPWATDEKNRLNPHNGLCLNSIHDKAFDRGFITIDSDFKIKISSILLDLKEDSAVMDLFLKYQNKSIIFTDKFIPSREFLDFHSNMIFQK
jgi:putative restriction endonuclease